MSPVADGILRLGAGTHPDSASKRWNSGRRFRRCPSCCRVRIGPSAKGFSWTWCPRRAGSPMSGPASPNGTGEAADTSRREGSAPRSAAPARARAAPRDTQQPVETRPRNRPIGAGDGARRVRVLMEPDSASDIATENSPRTNASASSNTSPTPTPPFGEGSGGGLFLRTKDGDLGRVWWADHDKAAAYAGEVRYDIMLRLADNFDQPYWTRVSPNRDRGPDRIVTITDFAARTRNQPGTLTGDRAGVVRRARYPTSARRAGR